jgi:hypothetical protein
MHYYHTHRGPQKVAYYALYILTAALTLIVGLVIWRQTLLLLAFGLPVSEEIARFLYILVMGFLSIGMLAGVLMSEPYLRAGMEQGILLRRFLTITLWLAVFAVVGVVLPIVIPG